MQMMTISGSMRRVGAGALLALAIAAPLRAQTAEPAEAAAAASIAPPSATSSPASAWSWTAASADFAMQALSHLGVPYRFGGNDPKAGFDCSGLVQWSFAGLGVTVPRTTEEQMAWFSPVAREELVPGDLVFFRLPQPHVGVYLGAGEFVHAPASGRTVERARLDTPWFILAFAGGGRLPAAR